MTLLVILIILKYNSKFYEDSDYEQGNYECQNPYFYKSIEKKVEYEGYFYLWNYTDIWQTISLNIMKLETFENGILYALELDQLEVSDPLDEINLGRRYLGYFYVTEQTVYYVSAAMEGYTEEENRKIIDRIQKNEAKFIEESIIVCCENGTNDITNEQGYHAFVEVNGERRIFRYYNDYFYGSKEYMLIVWEKGNGIVYYVHGNGNKNMHIEFGVNLQKEQQEDYGSPYKLFH